VLLERDSERAVRPDITFIAPPSRVPVVGLCHVEDYPWGDTATANRLFRELMAEREAAVVPIDTRLDVNATGLRTSREVERLIARMDVLLTTRLHGLVLALRNEVPVLAIDPTSGGGKLFRQASVLNWPAAFVVDRVTLPDLRRAFDYCLTPQARRDAHRATGRGVQLVDRVRTEFIAALRD
jgi:hypothetical protein